MFNETAAKPWQPSQPPGKGQEGRSGGLHLAGGAYGGAPAARLPHELINVSTSPGTDTAHLLITDGSPTPGVGLLARY